MGFRTDVAGALIGMKSAYLAKPAILLTGLDDISLHMALYPIVKMLHGQLHSDTKSINLLSQNKYYVATKIINEKQKLQSLSQSGQNAFSSHE